jgi:hypothetical protein
MCGFTIKTDSTAAQGCAQHPGEGPLVNAKELPRFVELKNGSLWNTKLLREHPDLWQEVLELAHDTVPNDVYLSLKQLLKK